MAEETTEQSIEQPIEQSIEQSSAGAPAEGEEQAIASAAAEGADSASAESFENSALADVDRVIASEDPAFVASMTDLKKQGAESTAVPEIDALALQSESAEKERGRIRRLFDLLRTIIAALKSFFSDKRPLKARIIPLAVAAAKLTLKFAKQSALEFANGTVVFVKNSITWSKKQVTNFVDLPAFSKFLIFFALGLGWVSYEFFKFSWAHLHGDKNGKYALPNIDRFFGGLLFRSFADVADARFVYRPDEHMEDFADPLLHPDHMMLLDKFIINLRRVRGEESNPMGLFEFYLEASNQESAVEIKDRQGEIRDIIARTVEQLYYDELVSSDGKEKMKVVLRKNINQMMTRGQLRHVFIKTIVLKP